VTLQFTPRVSRHQVQFIGNLGVLRGNGIETTACVYWHNKTTTFVSDIPGEVELLPSLWGRITFSQSP